MNLAIHFALFDKIIREETTRELKFYKSESLLTQTEREEEKQANSPAIRKDFIILGDEVMELDREKFNLKTNIKNMTRRGY